VSVQLVSKISNLYDPDPPTLQTDRQTDGRHAISIARYALVHRAVKRSKLGGLNLQQRRTNNMNRRIRDETQTQLPAPSQQGMCVGEFLDCFSCQPADNTTRPFDKLTISLIFIVRI